MDDRKNYSRVNKYDKRRKTTKSITIFMTIAIVLVIILIAVLIFGGKEEEDLPEIDEISTAGEQEVEEDDQNNDQRETEETNDETASTDEEDSEENEEYDEEYVEMSEIPAEEIDDPNVIEAYTANWKPIGTTQEEPHETVFDQESDDWNEMIQAIGYALKLEPEELTVHWIGNGGEQQVNGYVQSLISDEHYTVYLTWRENEGWQPIKVERVERFIHPKQAPTDTNAD